MSTSPIILILGAGPNIGRNVARTFAAKGYRTALAARSADSTKNTDSELHIHTDLTQPESIANVFFQVKTSFGIPSVVVYNGASATANPPDDPLSLKLADLNRDMNVNTISAFAAAQQAAIDFAQLPDSAARTFIYTGNATNTLVIPQLLDLGVTKSATAHIIECAAGAYKERGFKFYYADERKADGAPAYGGVDGEAHAKHYLELAEGKSQGPWQQTFVKGVGYKQFPVA